MKQCNYCGTEFEGNFCPKCGRETQKNKICPHCGSNCEGDAEFCSSCGYRFIQMQNQPGTIEKINKYLQMIASYGFILFSVLLFFFFIAPVAIVPAQTILGEKIPSESYGNAYEFSKLELLGGTLKDAMISFVVLGAVSFLVGIIGALIFYKKKRNPLAISFFMIDLSLTFAIMSASYIAEIHKFNKVGMGLVDVMKPGACLILVLVFALLMALILISAAVLNHFAAQQKAKRERINKKAGRTFNPENFYSEITMKASPLTFIGENAFRAHSEMATVQLGNLVSEICDNAFCECSLLYSVVIPERCKSFGKNAFAECRSLSKIFYKGTKAQWNAIAKGEDWDLHTGNYVISCTDGYINK